MFLLLSKHVGNDLAESPDHIVFCGGILDDDEDGIIARYGSQDVGDVTVVDVEGNAAGIAWPRLDDPHIAREIDGDEAGDGHHLLYLLRTAHALVH